MRFDEFMTHTIFADELFDNCAIVRGITWRESRDRQGATSQGAMRGPSQVRGVRATG